MVVIMYVMVLYDITNEQNKVRKICRKYLFQIQYSVYVGELDNYNYNLLETKLKDVVDFEADSLIILTAKNKNNLQTKYLTSNKKYDTSIL